MNAPAASLSAYPRAHPARCTRYRFRYSACDSCAASCPHEALALNEEGFELKHERCQNCGLCAGACPTGALQTENMPWRDWLELSRLDNRLTIACAPANREAPAIAPCLGALDPVTLAALLARGTHVELLGHDHCAECVHGATGADALAEVLDAVAGLRAAAPGIRWGELVLIDAAQPVAELRPQRRQFFRRLFGRGLDALQHPPQDQPPAPARAIRAAAPFLPSRRELLQALLVNGAGEHATLPAHPALPAGEPVIDPATCTACESCGRVCPTGALVAGETASAWVLRLNPPRCVGCGVCVEACHRGALSLAETITATASVRDLHVVPRRRCERCGRLYVTSAPGEGCPVCSDDNDSFSAIFG